MADDLDPPINESKVTPPSSNDGSITLQWSWIAITCLLLTLVAIGALIIVSSIKRADALSTIALGLAILSFIIQVGLFVAEAWQRTQSEARASQVNSETRSLLSEMKATARATNELVSRQFDTVLSHLIEVTENTVGKLKGVDSERLRSRLDAELRGALAGGPRAPKPEISKKNQRILDLYSKPLTKEEAKEARLVVEKIIGPALGDLLRLGEDDIEARRTGSDPGLFESLIKNFDQLVQSGAIVEAPAPEIYREDYDGQKFYVLSDVGRNATRYLRS